jgi:PTS system mannose-specific IIA component
MVQTIIVTHGNLARELIQTAQAIIGDMEGVYSVSNNGKAPQVLCEEIEAIIEGHPADRFIVFADFFGGSCCHACLSVEDQYENVHLITGVNLPMLLAFVNKRDQVSFDQLPEELIARGRDSMRSVRAEDL